MNENPTASEPSTPPSGRENNGRFSKGNVGGPGNPFARKTAALRAALVAAVSEQDIADIAAKLRDDAKAGDKAAIKILFQYVIGKPQPAVEPDTLDAQEMRGYLGSAFPPEVVEQMQRALPLPLLLSLWPIFLAAQEQTMIDRNNKQLADMDERDRRRAERMQRKAERRQRRQEERERQPAGAPSPNGVNGASARERPNGAPSTSGVNGASAREQPNGAPSPNGVNGTLPLDAILDWLRRRQQPPQNGSLS